jgi:3',5'-cyclic AMP phosphodiesterase CpdA
MDELKTLTPTRRDLMRAGLAAGAGMVISGCAAGSEAARPIARAHGNVFRVAHLTDMHVEPERRAGEGYAAALNSLGALNPRADLLVTGGDHVMDSTGSTLERAKTQWGVFHDSMKHNRLPVRSIFGNHDIFGWGRPREVPESLVEYGRALALDQLKLQNSYYSFDAGGWHFAMLDSMSRRDNSYFGELWPAQMEWLKGDLNAVPRSTPVIVFSHVPILSVCVYFDGADRMTPQGWSVPDSWMHRDARELMNLFESHGNVRLCVSGHIHMVDRVDYRGTAFICDGSVCGNWWKGPRRQFPEGYGVLDLHPDGRFEHRYAGYGWKAEDPEPQIT